MAEYKKIESGKAELTVTLEGDNWQEAKKKAYKKVASKIEIKGFRKGQAPKNMIDKYINHNEVLIEAAEALAQQALLDGVKEHDVQLIDRPELKLDTLDEDKCVLTFVCPVKPDVKLGDYKALEYKVEEVKVEDKEVDDQIATLLDRKADLELKEDGEVEDGDTAVIDFEGFVDGVAFEGGKGENYDLVIGSNSFIPGFESQLAGMKSEETKDINVKFPEDYQEASLKGKDATFKVTVHEIKKKVLPVLDDEFVKELKYENVNTVDELKNYTKENLEKQKKDVATREADNKLVDELAKIVEVEIPQVMIDSEEDTMVNQYEQRLMSQGLQLEQFLKMMGQTKDEFKASMKDDATKRVKINLALEEIAKLENVEVSDEDISKEYDKMAEMYGLKVEEIKQYVPEENVKEDLKLNKTLDLLKK
ncbi:MAG: trigger factor [Firmicutes bacterium]|nr:trigger factor [Candidatus Colivicinus equi]